MLFRKKKRRKSGHGAADSSEIFGRGLVMLSICAGAGLWGYALVNLATRAL